MEKKLTVNGVEICYELQRKKVKNINVRIRADSKIIVSADRRVPVESIEAVLTANADKLIKAANKLAEARRRRICPVEYADGERIVVFGNIYTLRILRSSKPQVYTDGDCLVIGVKDPSDASARAALTDKWLREQILDAAEQASRRVYPYFESRGVSFPTIRVRRMSSQWGNCRPREGVVTFNTRLAAMPHSLIDYVAAHELCHFLHPDHSRLFYAALSECMPDWQARKKQLSDSVC